ncbi:MAG: hypothetical protein IJX38_04440 [Clostridia bacterium]|nr:hypothetical protein [Clostridia bacterium]
MYYLKKRIFSFIFGGLVLAFFLAVGIVNAAKGDFGAFWSVILIFGIPGFTFTSCLILGSNAVGEIVTTIFSWGFVRMPGIIFTLDFDGIVFLIVTKILLFLLGIIIALLCGALGIIVGVICSVFVYPLALVRNIRQIDAD